MSIQVGGNVEGSIVVGDNNFVVNENHGTLIYKQAGPQVQRRSLKPQPPRAPRGFVNRSEELQKIGSWLAANEMVLVHAPDGMGKSALLRQAANLEAARSLPDGVLLLEGVDVNGQALGAEDVLQRLFDALFESDPPLKVNAATARTYLSNTRPLLVFDEVALPPALQNSLPDLFPNSPMLLSADTTTGGEFQRLYIKPLPRNESLTLLAAKAEITLNDATRQAFDGICAHLADVALALIITGNVLRETTLSAEQALAMLQNSPDASRDPIQNALDKAFGLAYAQLSPEEQKLLSTAAFTPGLSMSPGWLESALGNVPAEAFLERLKALGLLYANSPRLRLPAGFRAQARNRAGLPEADVLSRLTDYLLKGENSPAFVQEELGNFWGAMQAAATAGNWETALQLARRMDAALCLHGLWEMWKAALDIALEAARQNNNQFAEAWAIHQLGTRLAGLGQTAQAKLLLKQALALREKIGDTEGVAYSRHNLDALLPAPVSPLPKWVPAGLVGLVTTLLVTLGAAGALIPTLLAPAINNGTETPTPTVSPTPSPTPVDLSGPQLKIAMDDTTSQYGPQAEACGGSILVVHAFASDPGGIQGISGRYKYQYGPLDSKWYEAKFIETGSGQYRLEIDHNEDDRAWNTLDNLDGDLLLEVIATDGSGNTTQIEEKAPVRYANCDTSGPTITRPYSSPSPAYYGPASCTEQLYSEMHAFINDESGIQEAYIEYTYSAKGAFAPDYRLDLLIWGSNGHYGNFLYHNKESQAEKWLGDSSGYITWVVVAVDTFGNVSRSREILTPIRYCITPG